MREAGERNLEARVEREIRDRVERKVRERVERELRDGAGREEGRRIRSRSGSGSRRKERSKRSLSTISEEDYSTGEPKTCQELAKLGDPNSSVLERDGATVAVVKRKQPVVHASAMSMGW